MNDSLRTPSFITDSLIHGGRRQSRSGCQRPGILCIYIYIYIYIFICIYSYNYHVTFRLRKLTAPVRPTPLQHSSDPLGLSTMPYANASESDVKEHLANGFATIEQMLKNQSEKIEALTSKMLEHKKDTDEKLNRLSLSLEEIKYALQDLEFADNGFEYVGEFPEDQQTTSSRDTLPPRLRSLADDFSFVYIFPTGVKYHKIGSACCSSKICAPNTELNVRKKLAVALEREPCKKCFPAEKLGETSKSSA